MSKRFVRKVAKGKWANQLSNDKTLHEIIPADTITSCLKTSSNTLSIWDGENEEDAILALASVMTSLASIDVIIFEKDFFDKNELEIKNTIMNNPVSDLQEKHFDIVNLEFYSLGIVADGIAKQAIANQKNIVRYAKKDVKTILQKALDEGRVKLTDLNENMQKNFL